MNPSASKSNSRPRVVPREWAVALSGGLTLAFTAWGLGGVVAWSLHAMLIGGLLTFVLALFPLPRLNFSPFALHFSPFSGPGVKRLLRFPAFWLSLAFLLYLGIGAINPAAAVVRDERGWWVEAIQAPLGTWLPTSVRSDYEPMNAFRVLASFTAAFTLMWGLWIGITRRKVALLVLWTFTLSGAGMSLVAILQHLSNADAVLWSVPTSNPHFWGSFFYRNQGAAYLNLILVACGFLFFYHAKNAKEAGHTGGPHLLLFCLFGLVALSVGLALSRGGILFAACISLTFFGFLTIYALQSIFHSQNIILSLIPLVLLLGAAYSTVCYIDVDAIRHRFGDIEATVKDTERNDRVIATRATWEMAQDRILLGWGGGSFRYIFPMYQQKYPEIFYSNWFKWKGETGRQVYRYAHNDIVQFLAEYGAIGCGLLFSILACFFGSALRCFSVNGFSILIVFVGIACAFAHAFIDFIFNSPAYWIALIGFLAVSAKLLSLEVYVERRRQSLFSRVDTPA